MNTVKFLYKFRQIFRPIDISVFCRQKIKLLSELNYLQSSNFGTDVACCKESVYEEEGEFVKSVEDPTQPLVELTIITKDGKEIPITARVGMTVMKAIVKHDKLQMEAACDGELACTTCHVFCDDQEGNFTPLHEMEQDLLDSVPCSTSNSRLCCQMKIIRDFENVRIQLPEDTMNYFDQGAK